MQFPSFTAARRVLAAFVALMVAAVSIAAPASAQDDATIADTVVAVSSADGLDRNPQDFDILLQALTAADLVGAVADADASLSVFAPNDRAFIRLATELGYRGPTRNETQVWAYLVEQLTVLGDGDPIPVLTNILLYHVVPAEATFAQAKALRTIPTLLDGATVELSGRTLIDADPDNKDPKIRRAQADIMTSNGIIHPITRVLRPIDLGAPRIDEIVVAASSADGFDANGNDYDMLLAALTAADLVAAVADPDAALTVFAPKDSAFIKLAQDLGYEGNDEADAFDAIVAALTTLGDGDPIPVLTNVLLYHVSPDAQTFQQARAAGEVTTLLDGATFGVDGRTLVDNDPDLTDATIRRLGSNIHASNGVVHTISRVMIPLDI